MEDKLKEHQDKIEAISKDIQTLFAKLDTVSDKLMWVSSWANSEFGFKPTPESVATEGNKIRLVYADIERTKEDLESLIESLKEEIEEHKDALYGANNSFGALTRVKIMWGFHVPIWGLVTGGVALIMNYVWKRITGEG